VSAAIGERIRRKTKGRFCGENGEIFAHL